MSVRTSIALMGFAAATALTPAAALAWTRSYVVEYMAPAFYYGAPATGGEETPGTDCPHGINATPDWQKILTTSYRSAKDTADILDPDNFEKLQYTANFGFRGPNRENVYESPTSTPDPGFIEVTSEGNVSYGFDLDDNPNTGFKGVDGTPGVDNAYYKVSGCVNTFRGVPKGAYFFKSSNDRMRDGERTMLMVMSGNAADPMNDPDVTVGFYGSKDFIVKDANGAVTPDLTYRIDPKHQSMFKAKIAGGVFEATERPFVHFYYAVRGSGDDRVTELYKTKIKLEMKPDGSMAGFVGGYREWYRAYAEYAGYGQSRGGSIHENLGHMNMQGWYHALRRRADGLKDPKTGVNKGISTAFSLYLQPAYVMTPNNSEQVRVAQNFQN